MSVLSVLAENDPLTECKCKNEPTVCNQYSTDNTCVDNLPNLASPLDEAPDIIAKRYDYYNFGSEWTATDCGGKPKRHVGVDLGVKFEEGKKIPVYAVASGQVKADYLCSSSYDWARGIVIDHDGAFTTVYEHISPLVSVGQHVDKGQQIATVAKIEGYQHLHFGIKCGGYEAISTRGALPVEHGPCDKKTDCSTSGCRCDPLFPGPFIDPLDARWYTKLNLELDRDSMSPAPKSLEETTPVAADMIATAAEPIGRTLDWIAIKRNDINLAIKCEDGTCGKQDKYGHYWIEILDGPDGNPVESYGWWPMSRVSPMETLVGVQGELNGVTSFGGTPTSDPHQGDTADEEFHPRLTNTLTDQQVLDRIHEFVRSYKGEWRWTFGLGQNCRTFQTGLMNYVGLTK